MRGMALDAVHGIILMVFVLAILMFLFSGIWKDVMLKYGGKIGITLAGTEKYLIDSRYAAASIYCAPQPPNNNFYEIDISGLKASFEEPRDMMVILFYKGMAKLPESGIIPKDIIKSENLPRLEYRISSAQEPSGKESLSLNFFSVSEKCLDLGRKYDTTIDAFISSCAEDYIATTVVAGTPVTGAINGKCVRYECYQNYYKILGKNSEQTIFFEPSISFCCAYNKDARGNYRSVGVCPRGDTCDPVAGCSTRPPEPVPCRINYDLSGAKVGCTDRYGEHGNFCFGCRYICSYNCFADICECVYPPTCPGGKTCVRGTCVSGPVPSCQENYPYYLCNGQYISKISSATSYELRWRDCGVSTCCVFNNYNSYSCCPSNLECDSTYGCVDPNNRPQLCEYGQVCPDSRIIRCKGTNPRPDASEPNKWVNGCGYNPYVNPDCEC